MQSHNGFTHEKCQPDKPKHTPIPQHLCCLYDTGERTDWKALPPDLDRLFRAAPAWTDILEQIRRTADFNEDDGAFALRERLSSIENNARVALALLEEKP